MKLLLATHNLHKILELKAMLKPVLPHVDIFSLKDFPDYTPPEESGSTFAENALIKAVDASEKLQCIVLADDSGLVVPALNGEPGVFSRHYAGESATDKENRNKLLGKLGQLRDDERFGYFECALALAVPNKEPKVVKGLCEGRLLLEVRGGNGFGYDPLFVKHDYSKTFAELESDVKNRISHRRKALDRLLDAIKVHYEQE